MEPEKSWETKAAVVKALAHSTRLLILDELKEKPRSVGWLADEAGCDISTMSGHLSVLKQQNIVSGEKEGTTIHYQLEIPCIFDFFDCIDEVIDSRMEKSHGR